MLGKAMIIHNVGFYPYRTKLCVRQILPVTHPRFSHPMQHVRDVRDVMSLLEKGYVAFELPSLLPPLLSMLYILANVHWVLIKKVREYAHLCLMLLKYHTPLAKPMLCPPTYARIVGVFHKTFSEIQEKIIKMLKGKNLDHIYILWGVPGYVPLHKRKIKS